MKVAIYTLGCKVNTYESEYVANEFIKRGYELTSFDNLDSDIYVINTCTVTNTSDQKSRKMIRQARAKNKNAVVVAMGCFTQIRSNDNAIMEYINNKQKIVNIKDIKDEQFDDMEIKHFNTRTRALVKIEDGCENYCSYCIIPYVRGKVRSKDPKKVIDEVNRLVSNGYKEIVLTGIHTGHYGSDLHDYDFSDLLLELEKINGLDRIRISSIEITELNDKFLNVLKKSKKIVDHIHIPLQAGSNHILKLMNRKYDKDYYINKISKIRTIRPDIAITTDVIVGFPSESDSDFNETLDFVKEVNFAGGHVFPFSKRNGTLAAKMNGQLTKEEKHIRCKKLISLFDTLEDDYYKKHINSVVTVIAETYDNGYLTGHSSNYLKVKFKGCENLLGKEVNVKIQSMETKLLIGEML